MTDIKNELRGKLKDYLQSHHNIKQPLKNFRCLNPEHDDSVPSMGVLPKNNPVKCHCFACGANYDIFDLIGMDYGLENKNDQARKACELYGLPYDSQIFITADSNRQEQKPQPEPQQRRDLGAYIRERAADLSEALPYLNARGISEETARRFSVGHDSCFTEHLDEQTARRVKGYRNGNNRAVIIPNDSNSLNARFIGDTTAGRYAKVSNGIFNMAALGSGEVVFITEGVFDALSVEQLGYKAIALNGVNNVGLFMGALEQLAGSIEKPLIISLDNDEAGKKAADDLQKRLESAGVLSYVVQIAGTCKDANERLIVDRDGLADRLALIVQRLNDGMLRDYQQKKSALAYLPDFITVMENAERPFIPTGFKYLDAELDGGLYEGLYILGAVSSLGKTTYCLQIADQIARQGNDVIIFSLEMSRNELIAKSISRNTAGYCLQQNKPLMQYASTTRTITTKEKRAACNTTQQNYIACALDDYKTYAGNLYIYEMDGLTDLADVRDAIREHLNITRRRPVVIIDYLQIIQPAKDNRRNMTDKQQVDYTVSELKRISREYHNPIIAISSFNRNSYNAAVDLQSFKESGAIEYASDVLIGLQFVDQNENTDQQAEKAKDTRQLEAVILKNRNGQTGGKLRYRYYTPFNLFAEVKPEPK